MSRGFSDDMIVKKVSKAVRERTRENMEKYCMSLGDAFNEAVRSKGRSKSLQLAFHHSDYREYIPSAYVPEVLDFAKYPFPLNA